MVDIMTQNMESTGAKYGSWRPPDTLQTTSHSEETGNKVRASDTEFGLCAAMSWQSPFLECFDMQQVIDELDGVERVCNSMIARLPGSTHPPNEFISDISQAGSQENGFTENPGIPSPSRGPSKAPPVIVELSSDDESNEDSEVVQGIKVAGPVGPSPSTLSSPFFRVEINNSKLKADGESNPSQNDFDYEAHVFEVPPDLLQTNDNEIDEATWNERAEVLGGARKAEIELAMGVGEIPLRKKMKGGVDVLGANSLRVICLIDKSSSFMPEKQLKNSGKVSREDKAERLKEKERKKGLAEERREERLAKKRKVLDENGKLSTKEKEDEEFEEGNEFQEGDEVPDKPSKKELDPEEEIRMITSKLHGEKVVYEPYVWRNKLEEKEDEDSELDDVWQDMATVVAVSSATLPESSPVQIATVPKLEGNNISQLSKICEDRQHVHIDFDEDMGYFCDHCGAMGLDSPQEKIGWPDEQVDKGYKKICEHKNRGYKDEVGQYCLDCGLVARDIQKTFIAEVLHTRTPSKRKSTDFKELEGKGATSRVNLKVRDVDAKEDSDDGEVGLHLHPFYEDKLHDHQRDGFVFLSESLLGDKQGGSVGCILAHAPGTGKTFLMVSFIQSFLAKFPEGRPLILAPKIMVKAWQDEFEKFKVEDIPIFDLNGCNPAGMSYDEEDGEGDSCLPAHVKLNVKENRAKVLQEWQGSRGVLLMSYTLFAILTEKGLNPNTMPESLDHQISKVILDAPGLAVLDEGHLARTKKTKILKSLMQMRTKRRVLLSGTLFQNNFKELYTLLKLCREDFMTCRPEYARRLAELCGISVGKNNGSNTSSRQKPVPPEQHEENLFTHEFGDILENYVKNGVSSGHETEEINGVVEKLRSLTSSFVHWYPGNILASLPGLIEYSVHLNLTDVQEKVISDLPSTIKYHMSRHCKVLAACIHPSLVKFEENIPDPERLLADLAAENLEQEIFQGVKVEFILRIADLCSKANEKLLIFSTNLVPLSYIEQVFLKKRDWQRGREVFRLDGTMPEHERQFVIGLFNNSNNSKQSHGGREPQVLMASIKACKEGITLVGASRVVIIDNPDNPSVVRQAVSRAFRIGQKRKVYVYRLVTNNREEEELFRRSVNKEKLSTVLLDRVGKSAKKIGDFLQELSPSQVEDELLFKLIQDDKGRTINVVHRYNANG